MSQRSDLPHVNQLVEVALTHGGWQPSRVEDAEGDVLHLAEPQGLVARSGQTVYLRWITPRGLAELTTTVEARSSQAAMSTWRVRAAAAPEVQQRRRFVRARALLPVEIEWEEGLGLQRVPATSVDISEGGIQMVALGSDDVAVGRAVVVAVDLDGEEVRLNGDVLQSRIRPDGSRSVIVRFVGVRSGDADRVRKYVFRAQMDSLVDDRR